MRTPGFRLAVGAIGICGLLGSSHASMPPAAEASAALRRIEAAAQLRDSAPVILTVKVKQVRVRTRAGDQCPRLEEWEVDAEVLAVARGGFTRGQSLELRYVHAHYRCPGPVREAQPELKVGLETVAYLACSATHCQPAAGSMSFMDEQVFQREMAVRRAEWQRYAPRVVQVEDPEFLIPPKNSSPHFDQDSWVLNPRALALLEVHRQFLRAHPSIKLTLASRADSTQPGESSPSIAMQQAESVRAWLIRNGIASERIEIRWEPASSEVKQDILPTRGNIVLQYEE